MISVAPLDQWTEQGSGQAWTDVGTSTPYVTFAATPQSKYLVGALTGSTVQATIFLDLTFGGNTDVTWGFLDSGFAELTNKELTVSDGKNILVFVPEDAAYIFIRGYDNTLSLNLLVANEVTIEAVAPERNTRLRIWIDDVQANIAQDVIIAMTLQYYSPLQPDFVKFAYSNEFDLPPTSVNRKIFGLMDDLASLSQVNKVKLSCRIEQDGFEIIPSGYIIASGFMRDKQSAGFHCVVYSDDGDLYTTIGGRELPDLDYTDLNGPIDFYGLKDEAEIAGGSGEVFNAIIDLGQNIVDNAGTIEYIDNSIIVTPPYADVFTPLSFGYKQILQRIIEQAGFTPDFGELTGAYPNGKFNSLAVMQAGYADEYRFQYSDKFRQSVDFAAITDADETFTNLGSGGTRVLQFLVVATPSDFYEPDPAGPARSRYIVTNADTALGYFTGTFRFTGVVSKASGSGRIGFYYNGVEQAGYAVLAAGDNTIDITLDQNTLYPGLKDGDTVEVRLHQTAVDPLSVTYHTGCKFEFACFGAGLDYVYLNQILPAINQLDYYKDFLFRFGQIPREQSKTISFKSLKDILASTTYNDWTGKRVLNKDNYEFRLPLAQRNYYQYEVLDDLVPSKYGSGYYDLDDTTLPAEAVFVSIWGSTFDQTVLGITTAQIPGAQESFDASSFPKFFVDTGNRLFLTRQKYTKEPDVQIDGTYLNPPETDYTVACFTKLETSVYERSLSYEKVLLEWYTTDGDVDVGFLARLKDARIVTRSYKLTANDIRDYNPHLPIFDENQIFLFPTIKSFVADKVTDVEMLKL